MSDEVRTESLTKLPSLRSRIGARTHGATSRAYRWAPITSSAPFRVSSHTSSWSLLAQYLLGGVRSHRDHGARQASQRDRGKKHQGEPCSLLQHIEQRHQG